MHRKDIVKVKVMCFGKSKISLISTSTSFQKECRPFANFLIYVYLKVKELHDKSKLKNLILIKTDEYNTLNLTDCRFEEMKSVEKLDNLKSESIELNCSPIRESLNSKFIRELSIQSPKSLDLSLKLNAKPKRELENKDRHLNINIASITFDNNQKETTNEVCDNQHGYKTTDESEDCEEHYNQQTPKIVPYTRSEQQEYLYVFIFPTKCKKPNSASKSQLNISNSFSDLQISLKLSPEDYKRIEELKRNCSR